MFDRLMKLLLEISGTTIFTSSSQLIKSNGTRHRTDVLNQAWYFRRLNTVNLRSPPPQDPLLLTKLQ